MLPLKLVVASNMKKLLKFQGDALDDVGGSMATDTQEKVAHDDNFKLVEAKTQMNKFWRKKKFIQKIVGYNICFRFF